MSVTAPVDRERTDPEAEREDDPGSHRLGLVALWAAVIAVVAVSIVRLVQVGYQPIAPDDAAYVGVGRELWSLREPLGINGEIFTVHSWLFPLFTGAASRLFDGGPLGGDQFTGALRLGWLFGTVALALAVVVAHRLAGAAAAVATALALLVTPALWMLIPSAKIDVALLCFLMVVLLLVDTPTPGRMLAGGLLAGLTLLVKETSVLLVFLPLAYLGTLPRTEWRRLATRYVIGFAIATGWWFVTVLVLAGRVFPLEGAETAAGREVPREWGLNASALLLVGLFAAAWVVLVVLRRHEPRARLLMIAVIAFVPASIFAWVKELALRQFAPVILLSCIALGVAAADVIGRAVRRLPSAVGATAAVAIGALVVVPIAVGQDRTTVTAPTGTIDKEITDWITSRPGDPTMVWTFRYKAQVWSRISNGDGEIRPLRYENPAAAPALGPLVSLDYRQERYHAIERSELRHELRGADYLLLTGPHRLGPIGLATWLNAHGRSVGLVPVKHFGPASGLNWAYAYRVDHPKVDEIPAVVSTVAAERMVASDDWHRTGPTAIAGTRGGFVRLGRQISLAGIEQIDAPLR